MFSLIFGIIITALVLLGLSYVMPQVSIENFGTALIAAILIGVVNGLLFWLIPGQQADALGNMNLFAAGLSVLVSALGIYVVDKFMTGFHVKNFTWTFILALIIAVINMFGIGMIGSA